MVRQRKYLLFALLTLSVCALALYIQRHRQGRTGYIDNMIISVTGGAQKQSYYFMKGIHDLVDNYFLLVGAKKENASLHRQVADLRTQLAGQEEIRLENERLKRSLGFREQIDLPLKSANIIAHDVSSEYYSLRIDRGSADGIKKGMGVISPSGVVGVVQRVATHYADIRTLADPGSNIDAVIQRTRARGIVSGLAREGACKFKYIGRLEEVSVGDTVVSSGFGEIFPKGTLLGQVTAVLPDPSGVLQTVTVKSAVDIYRVEEVFIVFPSSEPETVS